MEGYGEFFYALWAPLGVLLLGIVIAYAIFRNRKHKLKRPDNQASETSDAVLQERQEEARRPRR